MSTISGCSVGDSGTQSDPEDRKVLVHDQDTFTNELKSAVMRLNYQTVPAPKPVKLGSFLLRNTTFETIEVCNLKKKFIYAVCNCILFFVGKTNNERSTLH